jgi:hypothetical protein
VCQVGEGRVGELENSKLSRVTFWGGARLLYQNYYWNGSTHSTPESRIFIVSFSNLREEKYNTCFQNLFSESGRFYVFRIRLFLFKSHKMMMSFVCSYRNKK